jgi:hypothetical protein
MTCHCNMLESCTAPSVYIWRPCTRKIGRQMIVSDLSARSESDCAYTQPQVLIPSIGSCIMSSNSLGGAGSLIWRDSTAAISMSLGRPKWSFSYRLPLQSSSAATFANEFAHRTVCCTLAVRSGVRVMGVCLCLKAQGQGSKKGPRGLWS